MAASASVPNELLPALAQITAILWRKLSHATSVGADAAAVSGVYSTGAATSRVRPAAREQGEAQGGELGAGVPSEVLVPSLTQVISSDLSTSSSPSAAAHLASIPETAPFSEWIRLLQEHPQLSPVPWFEGTEKGTLPPSLGGVDTLARWRRLPLLSLSSFADNHRYFVSEETAAQRPSFPRSCSTPEAILRRTLGHYASRLFLSPTTLRGSPPDVYQQTRGFKSRARGSTGLGRTRSQENVTSTLDELRAKFESRGSRLTGLRSSPSPAIPDAVSSTTTAAAAGIDRQSLSNVLRQHDQSPEIQTHLKVAFADGYATADGNITTNKQTGVRTAFKRLAKVFWACLALLIILQFLVSGFDGTFGGGLAGGASGSMNMSQHEVNPEEVNVTFSDVKGVDEAKEELEEIVDFLRDPERFSALGGRMPRGVLLVGKPGIGKTLLARAVAGEAGVPFFHASGSEFDEIFVGTGAKRVRQLFAAAKAKAPCVLFIDEIDTCGAKRTSSQLHPYANQTINQLLAEMDGFNKSEGVVVLGATNKRENLDPALLRPGRFDVEVQVWPPDLKGRTELFAHYLSQVKTKDEEVNAESLAKKTVGFLGAQIANMVNQAAIKAARDNAPHISMNDLEWALDKERMGPEKKHKIDDAEALRRTASHEAGHTIVNFFTQHALPINKVTITPRGHTLGRLDMMQEREHDTTRGSLLASLDVSMGGRVGEELILGEENVATGASSDFEKATNIASQIVKHWGMSNAAGTRTYGEAKFLSESMKEMLDNEIKKLLDESYSRAKLLLVQRRAEHQRLVDALLKYETLDADDIKAVIEGRDPPAAAKKYAEKNSGLSVDSKDIIAQGLRVGGAASLLSPVPVSDKPRTPS